MSCSPIFGSFGHNFRFVLTEKERERVSGSVACAVVYEAILFIQMNFECQINEIYFWVLHDLRCSWLHLHTIYNYLLIVFIFGAMQNALSERQYKLI